MELEESKRALLCDFTACLERASKLPRPLTGLDRLIRLVERERAYFASLTDPDQLIRALPCSNLPYYQALISLAHTYSDRLVALLAKVRIPPDVVVLDDDDGDCLISDNEDEDDDNLVNFNMTDPMNRHSAIQSSIDWHNAFNRRLDNKHPTMNKQVEKLRLEQSSTEMTIERVVSGIDVSREIKKYTQLKERLKTLATNYRREEYMDFLRAFTHNCLIPIDLICLQQQRQPSQLSDSTDSNCLDKDTKSSANMQYVSVAAAAAAVQERAEFEPLLWIKVVVRSIARLNAAWRGNHSTSSPCLVRQMRILCNAANWVSPSPQWIRPIVYHRQDSPTLSSQPLDCDLISALKRLEVPLLTDINKPYLVFNGTSRSHMVRSSLDTRSRLLAHSLSRNSLRLLCKDLSTLVGVVKTKSYPPTANRDRLLQPCLEKVRRELVNELEITSDDDVHSVTICDSSFCCLDQTILAQIFTDLAVQSTTPSPINNRDDQLAIVLDDRNIVNLDTSALIAIVSDLSYFGLSTFSTIDDDLSTLLSSQSRHDCLNCILLADNHPNHIRLAIESELSHSLLMTVAHHVKDSIMIACWAAVESFVRIVFTVGGRRERERAIHLLNSIRIVANLIKSSECHSESGVTTEIDGESSSSNLTVVDDRQLSTKQRTKVGFCDTKSPTI